MVAVEPRRIVIERSRPGSRLPPCLRSPAPMGGRHRGRPCSPRCRLRWNLRREKMPT